MALPQIKGYQIIEAIGQGGMAQVFLAIQENFQRKVAVKVLSSHLLSDPSFGERFLREARIVAQLAHQHIVPVFDVGQQDDIHYIAMELLPGGDLKHKLKQGLPLAQGLTVIKQVASAINYAADNGFIHRDIKPENILFRKDGSAVVSDFGIARATDSATQMTQSGAVLGTPHYMSPEQAQAAVLDGRSDLYSVGVMLFEMLAGRVPFGGENSVSIGIKHITAAIPLLPDEREEFQEFINQAMAKNPDDRFQTGNEFITRLELLEQQIAAQDDSTKLLTPIVRIPGRAKTTGNKFTGGTNPSNPGRTTSPKGRATSPTGRTVAPVRMRSRAGLLTMVLAGALVITGGGYWLVNKDADDSDATVVKKQGLSAKTQDLIAQANDAIDDERFFSPPENNAQYFFTTVLALSPGNDAATNGLELLVDIYLNKVAVALQDDDFDMASQWLGRVQQISFYVQNEDLIERQQQMRGNLFQQQQQQVRLAEKQQLILSLLQQAELALTEKRLTSPVDDNAYEKFQSVLALDPENQQAQLGIVTIAGDYLQQAKTQASQENFTRARALVAAALQMNNQHPMLQEVQTFIVAQEEAWSQKQFQQTQQQQAQAADSLAKQQQNRRQAKAQKISDLLTAAGEDINSNRLQLPVGNNAVAKYQQVLTLDPWNLDAQQGLQEVGEKYVETARQNIAKGALTEALKQLRIAQNLVPNSQSLLLARRALIGAQEIEAKQQDLIKQRGQEVAALLSAARKDIRAGRLLQPRTNNALRKYRQALALEPNNTAAKRGQQGLITRVLKSVETDIAEQQFAKAKLPLATLVQFLPGDASVIKMIRLLERSESEFITKQLRIKDLKNQISLAKSKNKANASALITLYKALAKLDASSAIVSQGLDAAADIDLSGVNVAIELRRYDKAQQLVDKVLQYYPQASGLAAANSLIDELDKRDAEVRGHISQANKLLGAQLASEDYNLVRSALQQAYQGIQKARQLDALNPVVDPALAQLEGDYIRMIALYSERSEFKQGDELVQDALAMDISKTGIQDQKVLLDKAKRAALIKERMSRTRNVF